MVQTLEAGDYGYSISVTDPYSASDSDDMSVTVNPEPNEPPVAELGEDPDILVEHDGDPISTTPVTFNGGLSSDPEGDDIVSYHWSSPTLTGGDELTGFEFSLDNIDVGVHEVYLYVIDAYGAVSNTDMFTVIVYEPNEAPVVALPEDLEITVPHDGDPSTTTIEVDICATSSDPDGVDVLTYSWASGETGECISKTLEAGEYGYTVTVTDPYGLNHTDDMTVTVNAEPNAVPTVTANSATVDIYMDTDQPITGFQFDVSGGLVGGGVRLV